VKLVINTGRPVAVVARELGVKEQTLGRWVGLHKSRQDAGDGALSESERAELARLRKENSELKMDRAFLKKSVALLRPGSIGYEREAFALITRRRATTRSRGWPASWRFPARGSTPGPSDCPRSGRSGRRRSRPRSPGSMASPTRSREHRNRATQTGYLTSTSLRSLPGTACDWTTQQSLERHGPRQRTADEGACPS